MLGQQRGQLPGHVAVHVVALRPRPLRRIEIKAGAAAEVVSIVLDRIAGAARRGVRHKQQQAELGGAARRAGLHGDRSEQRREGRGGRVTWRTRWDTYEY